MGSFDTRLVRNQDDEFHYRAKSLNLEIFQEPEIKLYYYPRDTPGGLFNQYFQYGKYKPLVLRKVRSEVKLRHLVPAGFVLYLLSLPLAVFWFWWIFPLLIYCVSTILAATFCGEGIKEKIYLIAIFPLIHVGYGLGFLLGLPMATREKKTENSRQ